MTKATTEAENNEVLDAASRIINLIDNPHWTNDRRIRIRQLACLIMAKVSIVPGSYPGITDIIRRMAADNNMRLKEVFDWPVRPDYAIMEAQAAKMSEEERETFAAGEFEEQQELAKKYDAWGLSAFLNEVFDGIYYQNFFVKD